MTDWHQQVVMTKAKSSKDQKTIDDARAMLEALGLPPETARTHIQTMLEWQQSSLINEGMRKLSFPAHLQERVKEFFDFKY